MSDLKPQHPEFFFDHEEGTITLMSEMPGCIAVSQKLLEDNHLPGREWIRRDGNRVTVHCDNGSWAFRIAEWRDEGHHGEGLTAICVLEDPS